MKKWFFILFFFGLLCLPNTIFGFTLSVTPTHETCAGNGSLTFTPSNTDPSGSITYLVYLLPNTTTPFASLNTTVLSSLAAGTYRVIATETVGATATTQQVDVTINNNIVPLTYTVQSLNQACSSTSSITITITTGVAVSYEIFNGPVTFPLQASNTFSGLPNGDYSIRVFDACGNGIVRTFTVTLNPVGLTIGPPVFSSTTPPSCVATVVTNTITSAAGTVIGYPLSIQYTVNPPGGGAPIITNSNFASGNATSQPLSTTIPSYGDLSYDYSIVITDACGTSFPAFFTINPDITLTATVLPINCNLNYFSLETTNFTPPYTLNFTSFPATFNPAAYNAVYPGPYNSPAVTFGSSTNPAPIGIYIVTITDACGKTRSTTFPISDLPPNPVGTATNNGCLTNSGTIVLSIPNYEMASVIITSAPPSYPFPLPHDVTTSIDVNHILTLNPVPLGNYTFLITEDCGNVIPPYFLTVPIYVDQGLVSQLRPGCELNRGSIRVSSVNGRLTSITITSAPSGFVTPFNGNLNIAAADGAFYMNGLDSGSYTFSCTDECNFTNTITVNVIGYAITTNSVSLQGNCGSFNVPLAFVSNGNANETFWLQKLINVTANTWGHPNYPDVGTAIYTNGTVPNSTNSFQLINNNPNLNNYYNGTFRVVRNFYSYNNGSELNASTVGSIDRSCFEPLDPLPPFNESLQILGVNKMPCSNTGSLDVIVDAIGTPPLHYTLIDQNGLPFFLDNGNSNIFSNLPTASYIVRVEDSCGNSKIFPFNVANLLSLVTITQPLPILQCQTSITGLEVFDLTTQSGTILGPQSPTDYTLTYHTSLTDAQSGSGAITNLTSFNPTSNPQTIYARLIFNQLPTCYETTTFDLIVGQIPRINLNPDHLNCSAAPVTLNASSGNPLSTTYLWSDGTTDPIKIVTAIGTTNLTVVATNDYGAAGFCSNPPYAVTVIISQPPQIDRIETTDWTDEENTITIFSTDSSAFTYSIDGSFFQDENTFTNLASGLYTVTIKDKAGCGTIVKEVWLLNYPKYFTPNGDGINETWYIKNQHFEPDFTVYVYDRYGKLMKNFKSNTIGWDGNYNGSQNIATDYWFVVYRQDGRVHKGHFALKR
ncbi:MAG: T9SS type B sorting domain-containing protein [Bacteroidota bacterium]